MSGLSAKKGHSPDPTGALAPGGRKNGLVSAQQWIATVSGRHLSGRPSRNTERLAAPPSVRHSAGARFRLHRRIAKGCTPDLVLPWPERAVFVDGDFWHGCPRTSRPTARRPERSLWQPSSRRQGAGPPLDPARRGGRLEVVRVWECEIREDVTSAVARILAYPQQLEHLIDDTPPNDADGGGPY